MEALLQRSSPPQSESEMNGEIIKSNNNHSKFCFDAKLLSELSSH